MTGDPFLFLAMENKSVAAALERRGVSCFANERIENGDA